MSDSSSSLPSDVMSQSFCSSSSESDIESISSDKENCESPVCSSTAYVNVIEPINNEYHLSGLDLFRKSKQRQQKDRKTFRNRILRIRTSYKPEKKPLPRKEPAKRICQTFLQKRCLPHHISNYGDGSAEKYFMDYNQNNQQKELLQSEISELEKDISSLEKQRSDIQRETRQILIKPTISRQSKTEVNTRHQLLSEQVELRELKKAMLIFSSKIESAKQTIHNVTEASKVTNIKLLEVNIKDKNQEIENLHYDLHKAINGTAVREARTQLLDFELKEGDRTSGILKIKSKIDIFADKENSILKEINELKETLNKEHNKTTRRQNELGEVRTQLRHIAATPQQHVEQTRCDLLSAEANKISIDTKLQRLEVHYEISISRSVDYLHGVDAKIIKLRNDLSSLEQNRKLLSSKQNSFRQQLHKIEETQKEKTEQLSNTLERLSIEASQRNTQNQIEKTELENIIEFLRADIKREREILNSKREANEQELSSKSEELESWQRTIMSTLPYTRRGSNEVVVDTNTDSDKIKKLEQENATLRRLQQEQLLFLDHQKFLSVAIQDSDDDDDNDCIGTPNENSPRAETASQVTMLRTGYKPEDADDVNVAESDVDEREIPLPNPILE